MEPLELEIYKRYRKLIEENRGQEPLRTRPVQFPETRTVVLSEILDKYDAFCFDGYGTLYNRGTFVYPGAKEWYNILRSEGRELRLVTNAASNVCEVLAKEATDRGFPFSSAETISSGSLLKQYVAQHSETIWGSSAKEVFYIGRPTGVNVLHECGIEAVENPSCPVVAVSSSTATDEMFAHAVEILLQPQSLLLLLNADPWAPNIDGSRSPVSGALGERLRLETGCNVEYFGKPFPEIWMRVRESLKPNSRVLMIGDTLGTDVFGAYVAGFDSALIVGRNEPANELEQDQNILGVYPTYYLVSD